MTIKARQTSNKIERTWMTEQESADYLRISKRLLQQWRYDKCVVTKHGMEVGPKYYKVGGGIRYRRDELDTWVMRKTG